MIILFTYKVYEPLDYVLEEIFSKKLNVAYKLTCDLDEYKTSTSLLKIKYTKENDHTIPGIWIPNIEFFGNIIQLLNSSNFKPEPSWVAFKKNDIVDQSLQSLSRLLSISLPILSQPKNDVSFRPVYFPVESEVGFDLFAHVFFLLSNFEEIQLMKHRKNMDQFHRIKSKNLSSVRNSMNLLPMVDIAIDHLANILKIEIPKKEFQIIPTADIDQCFQYQGKSMFHMIGGAIKNPITIFDRIKSIFTNFDHFTPSETVKKILSSNKQSKIFWLSNKKRSQLNKQANRNYLPLQHEIQASREYAEIGIHPSYQNSHSLDTHTEEKIWLQSISGIEIDHSRQHYIHLNLPKTYRTISAMNIKHDWSMGFVDNVGFRTGTSMPYTYFDILANKKLDLTIHPFCIMDVNCKNYLKINSKLSKELGIIFKQIIKETNGQFCFIFHNESVSETDGWKGWKKTIESWSLPI